MKKPYQQIAIDDCQEPLVEIPSDIFAFVMPHPYQKLGAPYEEKSPFHVRKGVLDRLIHANQTLQQLRSGWKLQIFDAYRPVAVQQFMVNYTFAELVNAKKLNSATLNATQREEIWQQVYQFWAIPNLDLAMPPPHSTGAAIDLTLIDETGNAIDMGSQIDEISARSFPDYFANDKEHPYHDHRQTLDRAMRSAGFVRHWNEWWHFSYGDQIWAWMMTQNQPDRSFIARYGRI